MDQVIICDVSALQYWRTPLIVRDARIPLEMATASKEAGGLGLSWASVAQRKNVREAERLLAGRLLTDLKGLSLPIHVMVPSGTNRRPSAFVIPHAMPKHLPSNEVVQLGNGLSVTSPALSLLLNFENRQNEIIARAMCEACGIYSVAPNNKRCALVIDELLANGELSCGKSRSRQRVDAYRAESGSVESFIDAHGRSLGWALSFDRFSRPTDLWKRPPFTSVEELVALRDSLGSFKGRAQSAAAVNLALDGLGSPLETQAALLFFSPRRKGGFHLPKPAFNQRLAFSKEAGMLAGANSCVCDMLWEQAKLVVEINGAAYHADRDGFAIKSGRTSALQSMGYRVIEFDYEQLHDIDKLWPSVMRIFDALGLSKPKATSSFGTNQEQFHRQVFSRNPFCG